MTTSFLFSLFLLLCQEAAARTCCASEDVVKRDSYVNCGAIALFMLVPEESLESP